MLRAVTIGEEWRLTKITKAQRTMLDAMAVKAPVKLET